MMMAGTAEAHTQDLILNGLAHELLHLQFILLPITFLVFLVFLLVLFKRGSSFLAWVPV